MGRVALLMLLVFVVTLAIVVGSRMSTEAMAVVVGVVCGVAAGIPMSVLLLVALNRRQHQPEEPAYGQVAGRYATPYPPVVVVQGGVPAANNLAPPYYPMPAVVNEPAHRTFRVIGEDDN